MKRSMSALATVTLLATLLSSCSSPMPVSDAERQVVSDASLMTESEKYSATDTLADDATAVFTSNGITPYLPQETRGERAQEMCDKVNSGESWEQVEDESQSEIAHRYEADSFDEISDSASQASPLANADMTEAYALMSAGAHYYCPGQYDEWVASSLASKPN